MRVAIITFNHSLNYGAILQAYALQETINREGIAKATVIDYTPDFVNKKNKTLKSFFYEKATSIIYKKRKIAARKFFENHINLTDRKIKRKELINLNGFFDCFISGSDQIWNYKITKFDKSYFLDFVDNKKKIAYAASFGFSKLPQDKVNAYNKLLSEYEYISVREKCGIQIVQEVLKKNVECLLDPTFLLNRKEWLKIAKLPKEKDYILIYLMGKSDSILRFAQNLSKKTGCTIIWINGGIREKIHAKKIRSASPEEFIGYFENAKYIITNSFHGLAFAINFNKLFFIEKRDKKIDVNSRFENILDLFNLNERIIVKESNNYTSNIDYVNVNNCILNERKKSIDFLKRAIGSNRNGE